jgi:hypothetical protein
LEDQISGGQPNFTLQVKVIPNARASSLTELEDGTWRARVRARPVDGKANAELEAMIAHRFGVPKSRVTVVRGGSSRLKVVKVAAVA